MLLLATYYAFSVCIIVICTSLTTFLAFIHNYQFHLFIYHTLIHEETAPREFSIIL